MSSDSQAARPRPPAGPGRRSVLGGLMAGAAAALAAPALRAADAPQRFTHVFGETELKAPARRVVSLGYNSQDPLLAVGVAPVALRHWYGDVKYGVWPWAEAALGAARPEVLRGEVSVEIVAGLQPDLVVAIGSGISRAEYDQLSMIAPVLMQPPQYSTYGTPWDEETRIIARAVGREADAETLIAGVKARFAEIRARHPDWAGRTAVAAWNDGGQSGAFVRDDTRARFLTELGFRANPALDALAGNNFYVGLSPEDLSALDVDLLIWISSEARASDIANLPMRRAMRAAAEGREIFAGDLLAGALSFGSVLSLPYALERIEQEIGLALDGDPATVVPSARDAGLTR